ncbi:MAG: pantoate--beta-alanine ligase [Cellulosilyticum sp.]|nr:pantoate--beta-alanine ligase [Cellulosilyticum sp.]
METIKDIKELKRKLERWSNGSVGLVHTRGPLNEGHIEMIKAARKENFFVVVSNIVLQREFNDVKEYELYPRYCAEDERKATLSGADFFFVPEVEAFECMDSVIGIKIKDHLKEELNGQGRPHYYEEQLTTLVKLFNIVEPKNFYMCDEDLQQVYFIERVLKQLHYDCNLKVLPAIRDENQLLLDSRKEYLKQDEKNQVNRLGKIFAKAQTAYAKGMTSSRKIKWHVENELSDLYLCQLEFVEIVEPERLRKIETIINEAILMIGVKVGKITIYDYVRLKKEIN